jgi:hypothetical protein
MFMITIPVLPIDAQFKLAMGLTNRNRSQLNLFAAEIRIQRYASHAFGFERDNVDIRLVGVWLPRAK